MFIQIKKEAADHDIKTIEVAYDGIKEMHITFNFDTDKLSDKSLDELVFLIRNTGIKIVNAFGFGNNCYYTQIVNYLKMNHIEMFPFSWIDGSYEKCNELHGIYLFGVQGVDIKYIYDESSLIGCFYEDGYAKYMYLGNIGSSSMNKEVDEQVLDNLRIIEKTIQTHDMTMLNIGRTWFYNRNLLNWYGAFNKVRTNFYSEKGILSNFIPASTCICGSSPLDSVLISSAISIKPKNSNVIVKEVTSPLQCSATNYGSSFSRAVCIINESFQKITVSGTASVDKEGNTIYTNDIIKQIDHTIQSVEQILALCNMTFSDTIRAFAYVKNQEHLAIAIDHFKSKVDIPVIFTQATICRDDFLFELELDAIKVSK